MANGGAQLEGKEGMLLRKVGTDDERGLRFVKIIGSSQTFHLTRDGIEQSDEIARARVIDIRCLEAGAGKLLQIEKFFVREAGVGDDAEVAASGLGGLELFGDKAEGLGPGDGFEFAVDADHRRSDAVLVSVEVEAVTAFHAEEFAVDAGAVAIVAANDFVIADTKGCLAATRTMSADGADMLHLPRAGFVAVGVGGESADGADVDAGAALIAIEVIAHVGDDFGVDATIGDAKRAHTHAFVAGANAAVTEDATGGIVKHDGRPLALGLVILDFGEARFAGTVAEDHVLEFALAALVANGAIEGVVGEEELKGALAGFGELFGFAADDHAFHHRKGAGGLELGHLFDFNETHAAGGLQRVAFVIAESGNFDASAFAGVNQQRARGGGELAAIDGEVDGGWGCGSGSRHS